MEGYVAEMLDALQTLLLTGRCQSERSAPTFLSKPSDGCPEVTRQS